MHVVTAGEMRAIDGYAIEKLGMPAMVLMENAGRAVAEEAARLARRADEGARRRGGGDGGRGWAGSCGDRRGGGESSGNGGARRGFRWLVLAGKGNNGGDGLVCARHLREMGFGVDILYAVPPETLTGEAALQRDIAERMGLSVLSEAEALRFREACSSDCGRWDGIVDALLGTGTSGPPREAYAVLIRAANESGLPIVSADIPSGLNADTGELPGACIRAAVTVALAYRKRGLMLFPGAEAAGEVVVRAIGIPASTADMLGVSVFRLDGETLRQRFAIAVPPERRSDSHKGTYGHALVAAGSSAMSGAGLLCARAALRAGSGLVSWAVPGQLVGRLTGLFPEAMLRPLADGDSGEWRKTSADSLVEAAFGKQAVVVGPGLGRWEGDGDWIRELWSGIEAPLVIDADGLNMLAGALSDRGGSLEGGEAALWTHRKTPPVLTPHPGEMARLCGLSIQEVQRDRIGIARSYARERGVILVLKGARTVVASPDGQVYINTTGNAGMSTGGAGDVLAGIVGALLAQGLAPLQAAAAAVYWHGLAGDRAAAARFSQSSLIAGDIIEAL